MGNNKIRRTYGFAVGLMMILLFQVEGNARSFRPNLLPNGNVFSCNTCHVVPGGPRNAFGLDVEMLVTDNGQEHFWSAALAAKDSDGDGFTNGEELGDPEGTWQPGDANPGETSAVTNPGDSSSYPEEVITSPGEAWLAVLSGDNVIPAVESSARGTALLVLHEPEMNLLYYLHVFDLQNVTAAHIHLGAPDANGGVIFTFDPPTSGSSSGSIDLTDTDLQNLKSGMFYVQVHTQQFPGGELRGQVTQQPIKFVAHLDSSNEIGDPFTSSGTGNFQATLSTDTTKLSYTLTVSGLEGITAAHIHTGSRTENGAVTIPIASASFTEISGEADVTDEILANLFSEGLYVNVHTAAHPAGEIRGQIEFDDSSTSAVPSWIEYQ